MLENEGPIRLLAFISTLLIMLIWQSIAPRRKPKANKWSRQLNNLSLIFITTLLIRFLLPVLVVSDIAQLAEDNQWGLFHYLSIPGFISVFVSVIILDFVIYWQHRLMHKIPLLWRLHRVHHSDKDLDATSGIRFHPIEIILSILIKSVAVIILGAPIIAVLIFEICLNVLPIFNHSNVNIPVNLDKNLRWVLVTPDMHRIHHSELKVETNSNYGFSVSIWDRLFNTYTDQPKLGQEHMIIGLDTIPQTESVTVTSLLTQPFKQFKHSEETS